MSAPASSLPAAHGLREDVTIVGVVACAHMLSHFFQLIVAPLFPWLRAEFGWSYAELGFLLSVIFAVSGAGQAAAGFAVDRFGARTTLCGGLACLALGAALFSISHSYAGFVAGAVCAGLGNSVFHPVDYWIINHRVSASRLAPAYSVHGVTGSLGWAAAPPFLLALTGPWGWRVAVAAAAVLPLLVIALAWATRGLLDGPSNQQAAAGAGAPVSDGGASTFGFLRLPAIWLCFGFFAFLAAALGGVQSFAPTVFMQVYGMAREPAAYSITLYMLANAAGVLAGGWLLAHSRALERNLTGALSLAVIAALVVATGALPAPAALACVVLMGLGAGLAGPSRDMLIRSAAPAGATGRVYGVVYSGLDAGIAVGPLVFGKMVDHGHAAAVFDGVALCLFGGVVIAWRVAALAAAPATARPA